MILLFSYLGFGEWIFGSLTNGYSSGQWCPELLAEQWYSQDTQRREDMIKHSKDLFAHFHGRRSGIKETEAGVAARQEM